MRGWRGFRDFLAGVRGLAEGVDGLGEVRQGEETLPAYPSTFGEAPRFWE
jgi:hypothetical protein